MPEHNPGDMGATMRLGKRKTVFKTTHSYMRQLYGNQVYGVLVEQEIIMRGVGMAFFFLFFFQATIEERHRHRYEVNPKYVPDLEKAGMKFVGRDEDNERMEVSSKEGRPGLSFTPSSDAFFFLPNIDYGAE